MRGATPYRTPIHLQRPYFNPRSPCGERQATLARLRSRLQFQPTLPMRGATLLVCTLCMLPKNFNPRSPCGERRGHGWSARYRGRISTHAPHAGSDLVSRHEVIRNIISTHAPHAGSDIRLFAWVSYSVVFQPTLPMRGATATYCVAHYIFTRYSQIS